MIKVRAIRLGYYGLARRKEGDEFVIHGENEFSKNWMEKVDDAQEPVAIQEKSKKSKQKLAEQEPSAKSTGDANVI